MDGLRFAAVMVLAYALGSIPAGYVWAKLLKNVDVTKVGSGRTGASNVLRAAGIAPAALTFLSDLGKGYGAVALARWLAPEVPAVAVLAALAAVAGHNWSVFLRFDGGVGSMTTVGACVALMPVAAAAGLVAGGLAILIWRYTSLGSLTLAAALTLASIVGAVQGVWPPVYVLFALGTSVMAVWELRPNIQRIRKGTERKLGQFIRTGQADVIPNDRKG
jgi:acyl phosphate:glycerol-3-phosphate acyltransferase